METVITAKGKTFHTDMVSVIASPDRAYIRIVDASLATAATVFSDKSETVSLKYGNHTLSRFTRLVAIVPEENAVKVILGKE